MRLIGGDNLQMMLKFFTFTIAALAAVANCAPDIQANGEAEIPGGDRRARQPSSAANGLGLGNQWSSTSIGAILTNGISVSAPQCFMLNACYGIFLTDPVYNYLTVGYVPCSLKTGNPAPASSQDPSFADIVEIAATSQQVVNKKGKVLPALTPATRYCHQLFKSVYGLADNAAQATGVPSTTPNSKPKGDDDFALARFKYYPKL